MKIGTESDERRKRKKEVYKRSSIAAEIKRPAQEAGTSSGGIKALNLHNGGIRTAYCFVRSELNEGTSSTSLGLLCCEEQHCNELYT